jgi:MFS family permease
MGGHSIAFPSAGALISRSTPPDVQGSVNGLLMAGNALARIVMPPALGLVYSAAGPDWPYYVCAALAVVALVVGVQAIALRDSEVRAKAAIV